MYYKVPKSSPTGERLTALQERMKAANDAAMELIKSIGAETFRYGHWTIAGGVSSIIFPAGKPEKSELKHWKRGKLKGEYMPSERTKQGKELIAKLRSLPRVDRNDLNNIVGYHDKFNVCGIMWNREMDYYLVEFMENWKYEVPADGEELTRSQYVELSKKLEAKEEEEESEVSNG
jgi:hypothetical protein